MKTSFLFFEYHDIFGIIFVRKDIAKKIKQVHFKIRTYQGRPGSGRTAERRGGGGQDWVLTEQVAEKTNAPRTLQGIEKQARERPYKKQHKTICKPIGIHQRVVYAITLSGAWFVYQQDEKDCLLLFADQWTEVFFVHVNSSHARHVWNHMSIVIHARNSIGR